MRRKASRGREREKWMAENEIKQKKRGFLASQATHHLAMKSSAVRTRLCKTSCLTQSAALPTHILCFPPTYFPPRSFNIHPHPYKTGLSQIDIATHPIRLIHMRVQHVTLFILFCTLFFFTINTFG